MIARSKLNVIFVLVSVIFFLSSCSGLQSNILKEYDSYKIADGMQYQKLKTLDIEIKNIPWGYLTSNEAIPINNELHSKLSMGLSSYFVLSPDAKYKLLVGYQGSRGSAVLYGPSAEKVKQAIPGYQTGDLLWMLEIEALVYIIDQERRTITPLSKEIIKTKSDCWGKTFQSCIPDNTDKLVSAIMKLLAPNQ